MRIYEIIHKIAIKEPLPILKIKVGNKIKKYRYSFTLNKFVCISNPNSTIYLSTLLKKYKNDLNAIIQYDIPDTLGKIIVLPKLARRIKDE